MPTSLSKQTLLDFGRISVQVRWAFAAFALIPYSFSLKHGWLSSSAREVLVLLGAFAVYNLALQLLLWRWREREVSSERVHRLRQLSSAADLAAFGALIYLTGTVESPFFPLFLLVFVFVGISATKLERMLTMGIVLLALPLLAVGEIAGWWPHHHVGHPGQLALHTDSIEAAGILILWIGLLVAAQVLVRLMRGVIEQQEGELVKKQRELVEVRAFQNEVLEQLPVGVLVFGPGGQILGVNAVGRRQLSLDVDVHRNLLKLRAVGASGLLPYIEQLIAGIPLELADFPYVADGDTEKRWLKMAGLPATPSRSGILVIDDITEAKQRESQERRIKERLSQADKFTSLGQMASGVAHELNNPLTAIQSAAQYLLYIAKEKKLTPDEVLEKTEHIVVHGTRIEQLIRGLIAYAKPGVGEHRKIAVGKVVDEVLGFSAFELRRAKIQVEKIVADVPDFLCAKVDLQQLILNLLTNARQALADRGGRIEIRVGQSERLGASHLRLEVADDGPGIPPEVRARIFEPFFTTKPEDVGTGLGLAIVQALTDRYEGAIQVETEVGQGTRFIVELPYLEKLPDWDPTGDQTFSPYR